MTAWARTAALLVSTWLITASAGCFIVDDCARSDCGDCGVAVLLTIVDAETLERIEGARVLGEEPEVACEGPCTCTVGECGFGSRAGTYNFRVEADGYEPMDVDLVVPRDRSDACCSCGYETVAETVELAPL